ncbi:hypothetical protein M8J77_004582 [Diaphorina citri]|nr:hypothetical protein M8J77_004582 [Diaphorina citri]
MKGSIKTNQTKRTKYTGRNTRNQHASMSCRLCRLIAHYEQLRRSQGLMSVRHTALCRNTYKRTSQIDAIPRLKTRTPFTLRSESKPSSHDPCHAWRHGMPESVHIDEGYRRHQSETAESERVQLRVLSETLHIDECDARYGRNHSEIAESERAQLRVSSEMLHIDECDARYERNHSETTESERTQVRVSSEMLTQRRFLSRVFPARQLCADLCTQWGLLKRWWRKGRVVSKIN